MSEWITDGDVYDQTGVETNAATISQATSIIELIANVDLTDVDRFRVSDQRNIRKAIVAQAAYLSQQPGLFTNGDYASLSQDGLSVTFRDSSASVLSPLSRLAVAQLSWMKPHPIRMRSSRAVRQYEREMRNGPIVTSGNETYMGTVAADVYVDERG